MTKRRALIVGAGGMGRAWGVTLRDDDAVEVVGWVDLHPEAAVAAVADLALDDVHSGDDLGQAIREARPDFVVDASIPQTHRDVTLQALHAGLPVLGEKPMSTSMTHAREMVAAAEDTGLLFMVSQNRSYNAKLAALRRLIQDDIGPLGILNSDFYRYIAPQLSGFRAELGSLLLLDMAIHTFDAARYSPAPIPWRSTAKSSIRPGVATLALSAPRRCSR